MKYSKEELAAIENAVARHTVPLSALVLDTPYQVRTDKHTEAEIQELAASIRTAGGILQNLVVVSISKGKYAVAAGEGRTRALHFLRDNGEIAANYPVPVLSIPEDKAEHASLIENHFRKAMNPADVFVAYTKLRDKGMSVEEIAAAHHAAVPTVRKMLALGDVQPDLLALFSQGKAKLEEMQALAAVSDHARQQAAWEATQHSYNRAHDIRRILAADELPGHSALARYVTVAAYEKAGGDVRRDLFAAQDQDVYLTDVALVHKLADEKMRRSKAFKTASGEGWAWIECRTKFDYDERQQFGSIHEEPREPTAEESAQLAALEAKCEQLRAEFEAIDDDTDEDVAFEKEEAYDEAYAALERARAEIVAYHPKQMALAGCVLHLDYAGNLTIERGLVKPDDRAALVELVKESGGSVAGMRVDLPQVKTRPIHSDALVQRLRAQRTIAAQAELLVRPNLALCLFVAQLVTRCLSHVKSDWRIRSLFDVSAHGARADLVRVDPSIKESAAWKQVDESLKMWQAKLPRQHDLLVDWLLQQPQDDVIQLQALLLSLTIYRSSHNQSSTTEHIDSFARRVNMDMTQWWEPTAESYFNHVSKERIANVVAEANAGDATTFLKMKKGDAAKAAEAALAGKGWLPGPLQTPAADPSANDDVEDDDDIDTDE